MSRTADIIRGAADGLKSPDKYNVHRVKGPLELDVEFRDTVFAEIASLIPGSRRKLRNVQISCGSAAEMYEILMLMVFAAGKAVQIR